MTRRRWIADEFTDDRAALIGAHAAHLARVLRARVGQQFDISAGGRLRRGEVLSVAEDRVEFALGEEVAGETALELLVLLAVIKFDRMEWAIEKLTELGVARIVPVLARRTDAHLGAAAAKRVDRWRRIAHEAAEQSRRLAPPEIAAPLRLREAAAIPAGCRLLLNERPSPLLREVLASSPDTASLALAIGPEGGWTDEEIQTLEAAGWSSVSLGETILRAETAAVAAVAGARALIG